MTEVEIPRHVEKKVRDAFGAVVNDDWEGAARALEGLDSVDGATAFTLAMYVCGYVVDDIFIDSAKSGDGIPSRQELRDLAGDIVTVLAESGAGVIGDVDEVAAFLELAGEAFREDTEPGPDPLRGLDGGRVIYLAFMCGGYLLGAFRRDDLGEHWWEYLDRIWAHALADDTSS
jgi:hypothetical protein